MGLKVIHSVSRWLPLTETWLHTQIASLPPTVDSHVICGATENLAQFAVPHIYCQSEVRNPSLLIDRIVRKTLKRNHLGFWYRIARRLQPSIWHSHFADQAWCDRHVVKTCGAKHVLSVYGADISQVPRQPPWDVRIPEMLQVIDLVLCEGPAMARQVMALGCPAERVRVHHLGIPLERIPFQPRRWHPGMPLRVLIAGTFREKKGIPYALEALGRIKSEVDLEITLMGDATAKPGDAEEKRRIKETIERCGLVSVTRLPGFQPYSVLLKEAQSHHIFLSPSVQAGDGDNEGGAPVVITEMAASGMLIISTRHCDIPEVVPDGHVALLADERDVDGLEEHLRWAIRNPDKWIALQKSAREHIEREFSASIQGQRLALIYHEVCGEG
jgi:colanic acid/amylovoran biosynthesis glycosyltransferase